EDSVEAAEVTAISNNGIDSNNNILQHKLSKTRHSQSKSKLFAPFKPPFKNAKISHSKCQRSNSQE
ncbi:43684_t:CDS:2, partial [Gigaspora margarita]